MGDHLALFVDRLLTEATLEATIRTSTARVATISPVFFNQDEQTTTVIDDTSCREMVECRICQDEDYDNNMEAPCSCCGSLKYAHRKCIQRWCNEKGDTECEICLQPFQPGYTAPQRLYHYGTLPTNFSGDWENSGQGIQDSRIITMAQTDDDLISQYDDEFGTSNKFCCRTVALIFLALLVLRHTLPLLLSSTEKFSMALFVLLVLRTVGIVFPIIIMARALSGFHRRHRRQQEGRNAASSTPESELEVQEDASWLARSTSELLHIS